MSTCAAPSSSQPKVTRTLAVRRTAMMERGESVKRCLNNDSCPTNPRAGIECFGGVAIGWRGHASHTSPLRGCQAVSTGRFGSECCLVRHRWFVGQAFPPIGHRGRRDAVRLRSGFIDRAPNRIRVRSTPRLQPRVSDAVVDSYEPRCDFIYVQRPRHLNRC